MIRRSTAAVVAALTLWTGAVSAAPRLQDAPPKGMVAYARMPEPWSIVAGGADRRTGAMGSHPAILQALEALRAGAAADSLGGRGVHPLAGLAHDLTGPVEVAVLSPNGMASPLANALVRIPLPAKPRAAFNERLTTLIGAFPELSVMTPAGDDGHGAISAQDIVVPFHYAEATGVMHLLAGLAPTADELKAALDPQNAGDPAVLGLTGELDHAGDGGLVWLNMRAFQPIFLAGLSGEELATARTLLSQLHEVAIGWGSVDGKGRMGLRAIVDPNGWVRMLPRSPRTLRLNAAGRPHWAFAFGLPSVEEVDAWPQLIAEIAGEEGLSSWNDADAEIKETTGVGLAEWSSMFGPEAVVFSDEAGMFFALRLTRPEAWKAAQDLLVEHLDGKVQTYRHRGITVNHLSYDSVPFMPEATMEPGMTVWLSRLREHAYWVEEDGYLIFSDLPQSLYERAAIGANESLDQWLRQTHGLNSIEGGVLASVEIDGLPKRVYRYYLAMLQVVGDLAGSPVDIAALPTARDLDLPPSGAVTFQMTTDNDRLGLTLSYEQTPAEFLLAGGGVTTIAVAGILAAVAIPAYQDYTVRAEVAGSLPDLQPLKQSIEIFHDASGRFPDAEEADQLITSNGLADNWEYSVFIESDTGVIELYMDTHDKMVTFYPELLGDEWVWSCDGDVDVVPASLCPR